LVTRSSRRSVEYSRSRPRHRRAFLRWGGVRAWRASSSSCGCECRGRSGWRRGARCAPFRDASVDASVGTGGRAGWCRRGLGIAPAWEPEGVRPALLRVRRARPAPRLLQRNALSHSAVCGTAVPTRGIPATPTMLTTIMDPPSIRNVRRSSAARSRASPSTRRVRAPCGSAGAVGGAAWSSAEWVTKRRGRLQCVKSLRR